MEAIVRNCEMKTHGSSSRLGPPDPASRCPSVLWFSTESSCAQQFCPSCMGFVQLRCHVADSCSLGEGGRSSEEMKYYFKKARLFFFFFLCIHYINAVAPPDIWQVLWLCLRDFGEGALAWTLNAVQENQEEKKLLL